MFIFLFFTLVVGDNIINNYGKIDGDIINNEGHINENNGYSSDYEYSILMKWFFNYLSGDDKKNHYEKKVSKHSSLTLWDFPESTGCGTSNNIFLNIKYMKIENGEIKKIKITSGRRSLDCCSRPRYKYWNDYEITDYYGNTKKYSFFFKGTFSCSSGYPSIGEHGIKMTHHLIIFGDDGSVHIEYDAPIVSLYNMLNDGKFFK
jgi:hypothetical protein